MRRSVASVAAPSRCASSARATFQLCRRATCFLTTARWRSAVAGATRSTLERISGSRRRWVLTTLPCGVSSSPAASFQFTSSHRTRLHQFPSPPPASLAQPVLKRSFQLAMAAVKARQAAGANSDSEAEPDDVAGAASTEQPRAMVPRPSGRAKGKSDGSAKAASRGTAASHGMTTVCEMLQEFRLEQARLVTAGYDPLDGSVASSFVIDSP